MKFVTTFGTALWLLTASLTAGQAGPMPAPKTEPILEVAGAIGSTNGAGVATFDREMLEALGLETVITTTPWHKGQVRFEGVPLTKLLETVQARGQAVKAIALNDYVTTLPVDDFARYRPILALKRDGQYMPIRDKGPLFIIYPYDKDPQLQSQMYYARSAWQVKRLEVQP